MNRLGIVVRTWNDAPIPRRDSDGYVNATAVCQANGKEWYSYIRTQGAKAYVRALSEYKGLPVDQLIISTTTGPNHLRGTWIHPRLAVDLAREISPPFAVWMDGWISEPEVAEREQRITTTRTRSQSELRPARTWTENERLEVLSDPGRRDRAIQRICRAALRRGLTHVMPRDVVQWRVFGRCPLTTRESSALLSYMAHVHNLGAMEASPRSHGPNCLRVDLSACLEHLDDEPDDPRNAAQLADELRECLDQPSLLTSIPKMLRRIERRLPEWAITVA